MKNKEIVVIEEKTSPIKLIFTVLATTAIVACAAAVAYKHIKEKLESGILGKLDLDGDGEAETLILDTTGDGEVDTIIINSEHPNDEE